MIRTRVKDGTRGTERVCDRCSCATIMKGSGVSQERVYCNAISEYLTMDVVECSSFRGRTDRSLTEMYMMALILEIDKKRGKVGFVTYQEWQGKNKYESLVPQLDDRGPDAPE